MLVPARNISSFVDKVKSSDVAETVTVIFDGRMAKDATRISTDMLTELEVALSFPVVELCRNCTWNTDRFVCVYVHGGVVSKERGHIKNKNRKCNCNSKSHYLQILRFACARSIEFVKVPIACHFSA